MKKSDMTKKILENRVGLIDRVERVEKVVADNALIADKNFQQMRTHDLALAQHLSRLEVRVFRLELPLRVRAWRRIFGEPKPKQVMKKEE